MLPAVVAMVRSGGELARDEEKLVSLANELLTLWVRKIMLRGGAGIEGTAEDIVNDFWVKVLTVGSFRAFDAARGDIVPYLLSVVRYTFYETLRRNARHGHRAFTDNDLDLIAVASEEAAASCRIDTEEALVRLPASLAPFARAAIFGEDNLAERHQLTQQAVCNRLHRARQVLRRHFLAGGYFDED